MNTGDLVLVTQSFRLGEPLVGSISILIKNVEFEFEGITYRCLVKGDECIPEIFCNAIPIYGILKELV